MCPARTSLQRHVFQDVRTQGEVLQKNGKEVIVRTKTLAGHKDVDNYLLATMCSGGNGCQLFIPEVWPTRSACVHLHTNP